jgi:hypothetical protein
VPNCRLLNGVASTAPIVYIYINGNLAYRIHISVSAENSHPWYCDICGEDTLFVVLKQWRWKIIFIKNTNVQDVQEVWNRIQWHFQERIVTASNEITLQSRSFGLEKRLGFCFGVGGGYTRHTLWQLCLNSNTACHSGLSVHLSVSGPMHRVVHKIHFILLIEVGICPLLTQF